MTVTIRKATIRDIKLLQKLAADSFNTTYRETIAPHLLAPYIAEHFSLERLTQEFSDEKNTFLLALDGDQLAGYMKLRDGTVPDCVTDKNCLEVERIYADPVQKRRGIGSTLIAEATKEAKSKGRTSVWLGVFQKNTSAVAFYQAKGFEIAGHAIFVMGGEEQDDYVMMKVIS